MQLRPHNGPRTVDIPVESSSEKKVRYFLIVVFFIQVLLTTTPFMHETLPQENGRTVLNTISALQFIVQTDGFMSNSVPLALICLPLIIFPLTSFFFCIFDKRSRVKYIATAITSIVCAIIIVFGIGKDHISIGAVITLIINVITLFMTMQGVQAVSIRRSKELK